MSFDLFKPFTDLTKSGAVTFNKEYGALKDTADTKIKLFHEVLSAENPEFNVFKAYDELSKEAQKTAAALAGLKDAEPKALQEAREAAAKAEKSLVSFLRGESEHTLAAVAEGAEPIKVKLTDDCGQALRDAFKEAQHAAGKVAKPANSYLGGIVRTQENGWRKALNHNADQMKFWKEGLTNAERGIAFGRVAGVGASGAAIADGIFRSQTRDGEDRGGLARTGEVAVGTAGLLASLVGGSAKSLARL